MNVSPDGCIRLTLETLLSLPLKHLMSGIDDTQPNDTHACGKSTSLSGYTEWLSTTEPVITMGWDVALDTTSSVGPLWVRVGLPRTNVRLINTDATDMEWHRNLQALATVVDALPWQQEISRAIAERDYFKTPHIT
jgi:hypothetical protein